MSMTRRSGWYCKFCWYNTTAPTGPYALDVHGTANITSTININGILSATQGDATALAIALG